MRKVVRGFVFNVDVIESCLFANGNEYKTERNLGTKKLNNFLKVIQLVTDGAGITQLSKQKKKRQVS